MGAETRHTPNNQQFAIRLPAERKARLETYAQLVGRPQASVASEALADHLGRCIPQIGALKKAVAFADQGDFASREEVELFFNSLLTLGVCAADLRSAAQTPRQRGC